MPLGIVSDDDFESEKCAQEALVQKMLSAGRPRNRENIPTELQNVIVGEAISGTNQQAVADAFGITQGGVSYLERGDVKNPEVLKHRVNVRDKIIKKSTNRLNDVLNAITPVKIAEVESAKELTSMAKDLAGVVKQLEPEARDNNAPKVAFVFMAPPQSKESDFDFMEVVDAE